MLLLSALFPFKHTAIQLSVLTIVAFLSSFIALPSVLLYGLNTYVHPENIGNSGPNGPRAAIRRPSDDRSIANSDLRKRKKSKTSKKRDNLDFDESGAQLFRLRLVDSHIRTRIYFPEYRTACLSSFVALSSLLLIHFFPGESSLPAVFSFFAISYLSISLGRLLFERSATKIAEKQISSIVGFLGFLFALTIEYSLAPSVFDFRFSGDSNSDAGFLRITAALMAGYLAWVLFVPATRAARALWIGTDQLRWNIDVVSCGFLGRGIIYVSFVLNVFTVSLWINPLANVSANAVITVQFRLWFLFASAIAQFLVLRPNLQMYLNEAVLSWYQRLHSSKLPDLDFGRAKIFLHNYYLCLVVLQFFAPPMLVVLFLGLSQMKGNAFTGLMVVADGVSYCSLFKEVSLFLAWWILFIWVIFMSLMLSILRSGFLYVN
ncbi:hypothetical protein ZOSMA_57G00360 [Zostera marina]|uniref:Transmembrane protein n=1 Tax=Zostera marina TaxID=29655 RepID=A0A0K9NXP6_ZOSMR|nr:hypothetical protein ZOSMA_57G00360 [Zostera marina]